MQWREPIYIAASFAGVVTLPLLLIQPLLAAHALPGLRPRVSRRMHVVVGASLVLAVLVHVGGLWITSPPDVVDALLLRSPTPFSLWGVIAMWALLVAFGLAVFRRHLRPHTWRLIHLTSAAIIVAGAIAHALLIEGTMGTVSKVVLCGLVAVAAGFVVLPRLKRMTTVRRSEVA